MTTRTRLTRTLALAAVLALAAAGCRDGEPDPDAAPAPTKPPVEITAPQSFDTSSPAWSTLRDLPGGKEVHSTISDDGSAYAYAYQDGDQVKVGQVDLETGKKVDEQSIPAILDDPDAEAQQREEAGTDGAPLGVQYSGNQLLVFQENGDPDEGAWNVSILPEGMGAPAKTIDGPTPKGRASIPGDSNGLPRVDLGNGKYAFVNANNHDITVEPKRPTRTFTGCGGEDCKLEAYTVAYENNDRVETYEEPTTTPQVDYCGGVPGVSKEAPCLKGFRSGDWNSQDDAPDGADPKTGELVATGSGYMIGKWHAKGDGPSVYKAVNLHDDAASDVEFTCDGADAKFGHVYTSENHQYLVSGDVLVNVKTGDARCFTNDEERQMVFRSVQDNGTAWGMAQQDGDTPLEEDQYSSGVVSASLDNERPHVHDGEVAVPLVERPLNGPTVGVFVNADQAVPGKTVIAAYPVKQK